MAKKNPPEIGEIRIGRAGNKYNKWDGKRWVPVSAARTAGASGRKASVASKAVESKPKTTSSKSSSKLEGPKKSQKVTRVGSTVKMGPSKFVKPTQKTPNRPTRGQATQIATDRSGQQRWVKYVKPKGK